jgi:acyl-CoA thioesterase FadM
MGDLGLDLGAQRADGRKFIQTTAHCRYHREQFPGAVLAVQGGVLGVKASSVQVFHEVLNGQTNEPAATFIIDYALIEAASRAAVPFPGGILADAARTRVALPPHGAPRSIDLGPPRLDLTYEDVLARVGDTDSTDMMGGRAERLVDAEDCDAFGYLHDEQDMMFSPRRLAQLPPGKTYGPPVYTTDEGHRFGWAWLETLNVRVAQPRAGDTLRTIGAEIGIQSKTRHSRRWTFNKSTGALASINDTVGIALDLDARRPIVIPANIRRTLEAAHTPEFA